MTGTDSNGVPLTRRQIREQAAAAAAAAGSGTGAAAPTGARPEPARPPQAPAPEQRRSPQPVPEQRRAPQASPPAQRQRTAEPSRTPQPTRTPPPSRPAQPAPAAQPTPTAQPSRVGHSRVQQPPREDPSATSSISRRSLREQTGVQRPVVVPPIQSNAIRTVDETGELSGLRDLGTGRNAHAAPSARPESAREPAPAPVQRQPVQRQPVQRQPVQRQPVQRQPVEAAPATPAPVQRQSLQGLPTRQPGDTGPQREHAPTQPGLLGADAARRPWPLVEPTPGAPTGAPAAFRTPQVSRPREAALPDVDDFHQRISLPEELAVPDTGAQDAVFADELPRWDAITATPATSSPVKPLPPVANLDDEDDLEDDFDDDDDDDDENEHKYTWLHYLILVAVAFVLGLIIWKVGLEGRGEASPPATTSSAGVALQSEDTVSDLYL